MFLLVGPKNLSKIAAFISSLSVDSRNYISRAFENTVKNVWPILIRHTALPSFAIKTLPKNLGELFNKFKLLRAALGGS